MIIAGDPSGDQLAAELVGELRRQSPDAEFFGAGGPHLRASGVDVLFDLTQHAVIGLLEVISRYKELRRIFRALLAAAKERRPEVIIGVDYGGFNLRFAQAARAMVRNVPGWRPRIVQYVSPQVWASRPGRARVLAANHDLVLSILPFEKAWYAARVPELRVEFVGHPLVDRHLAKRPSANGHAAVRQGDGRPLLVLLPGSRRSELQRHWRVMQAAVTLIAELIPIRALAILPTEELSKLAQTNAIAAGSIEVQVGGLGNALEAAQLALASTGTVTLECAWFGVPTLAMYRTSWSTYQIGRRIISVPYLAMPNLLAGKVVMPEFIQDAATPENLAQAAIEILKDPSRQSDMRRELRGVIGQLGGPGASCRAANHIMELG